MLSCLFYEEVQLYLDIRNKNLNRSRLTRLLVYLPLQVAFILFFGWQKYLFVFLGMRIVGFSGWIVFSWGIHQPFVYRFGFSEKVPALLRRLFAIMNGNRVIQGVIHHATHHAWPGIPAGQLHEFDAAVLRNPSAAPELRAIGQ